MDFMMEDHLSAPAIFYYQQEIAVYLQEKKQI